MSDIQNLPARRPGQAAVVTNLPPAALVEIAGFALRLQRANGPVMRAMNNLGGQVEARLEALPMAVRRALDGGTAELLTGAYRVAGQVGAHPALPETGEWGHRIAVFSGGALGGFGGLGSALVELPATVTLFFSAMQKVAGGNGFDPASHETRQICLEVFGAGGPLDDDDGVNTSFLGTRIAVNGTSVQALIRQVAPALAAVLGRKLASQAVPVLGAAAGAGVNLAFLSYYRDMAHIRFGLTRLAGLHGEDAVAAQFRADLVRLGLNKT